MESLSSEKSLKSRSFPCLGPSGTTEFPADCVFRERKVPYLPWVEIKSHLPLKIAGTSMGMVGFDQRWLPILQGLNTILHQFSQIQVQQAEYWSEYFICSLWWCTDATVPMTVLWREVDCALDASGLVPLDPVLCIHCKYCCSLDILLASNNSIFWKSNLCSLAGNC